MFLLLVKPEEFKEKSFKMTKLVIVAVQVICFIAAAIKYEDFPNF